MKSRFAYVKRPLLALMALAAMIVASGLTPAAAIGHNNLSGPGTIGRIRVRPVMQERPGATAYQYGDVKDFATNPNRTVGDVPAINGTPSNWTSPCRLVTSDCLRVAGNNDAAINASAADGHTHYHAGDNKILVNDTAGFRAGDTILVGSPYCNHAFLQLTCKRFVSGFGMVNEQPTGEVAYVVGGDISVDDSGPGVLELASGLTAEHPEGTQIAKLPTMYQGQQAQVDISHADLLNCSLAPPAGCNANNVAVRAWFIPPQGSHDNSFPRRPLSLNRENPTMTSAVLAASCATTACGTGNFSFFIPKEITGTGTVGKGFSVDTTDTWYTVIVEARDVVTNSLVADGISRFKLNPTAIVDLNAANPRTPNDHEFFPMESVEITGGLKDNSNFQALSKRPVEDVIVNVTVTKPDGSSGTYRVTSCVDNDGTFLTDACGGDIFGGQPNQHGRFQVTFGGPQGVNLLGKGTTCNEETNIIVPCIGALFTMLDTFDTGTYDVLASLATYAPPVTATTTFDVVIF